MSGVFLFKIKQNQSYTSIFQPFWKYLLCNLVALCCLPASGISTNRNKERLYSSPCKLKLIPGFWVFLVFFFFKNGKDTEACIRPYYDSQALGLVLNGYPNSRPSYFLHPSIHTSTHPSIINLLSTHPFKISLLWAISRIFSLSASK